MKTKSTIISIKINKICKTHKIDYIYKFTLPPLKNSNSVSKNYHDQTVFCKICLTTKRK